MILQPLLPVDQLEIPHALDARLIGAAVQAALHRMLLVGLRRSDKVAIEHIDRSALVCKNSMVGLFYLV